MESIMTIIKIAREIIKTMDEAEFILVMCMMFDEFSASTGGESKAPEMAKTVAELVDEVNKSEGAYLL